MFSVSQAALRLGVCAKTIRRWDKARKILCTRTIGGHRRISVSEMERLLGLFHRDVLSSSTRKRCAVYARVSGYHQKTDGDKLLRVVRQQNGSKPITSIYCEVGTSVIGQRKPLSSLLVTTQYYQIIN